MNQDTVGKLTKSHDEIIKTVITNMFKMMVNRELIDSVKIDGYVEQGIKNYDQNHESVIKLDSGDSTKLNTTHIAIKFVLRKISAISKETDIEQFMKKSHYKFIFTSDGQSKSIRPKLEKKQAEGSQLEVFDVDYFKLDLFECDFVPYQRKLSQEEVDTLLKTYKFTKANMNQMCYDDPVAFYLNLKPGDIVEIKRPSVTCGYEPAYRIVSRHAQP